MMKRFLSTTAILISLSGAAYAESHTTAGFGTVAAASTDFFASDLIGMRVPSQPMGRKIGMISAKSMILSLVQTAM